ncbi:uncharacterized protein LOC127859475 [Dreissena polymorpha]|uniref:Uncharacterized protein n=1 Tax=Dreissena polymorpha TaxID=45954 RepID=A0A9D4NF25_DREPO|nr:uncharacterized protein LOC127859475 [Dreissena polymorpha]XP_052252847.1 uncharacterized protein LOC127859475 [Dreissena polymorpha]KAH3893215.1 hypothetical protein DPMN_017358 [Dreissena polymorpha]
MDSLLEDSGDFLTTDTPGRCLSCSVNHLSKTDGHTFGHHHVNIKQCVNGHEQHTYSAFNFQSFLTLQKYHCTSLVTANSISDSKSAFEKDVDIFLANETAWERIKRTYNLEGEELIESTQQRRNITSGCSTIICATFAFNLYKGYLEGRGEFKNKYALVLFRSQGQAQRRRYNYIVKTSMGYGIKYTWKMARVFLPILVIQQLLEVYWNKTTPLSFIASVGSVGLMSSIGMDLHGMFARTLIGSALGAIGGLLWTGMSVMAGQTQEELNRQNVEKFLIFHQNMAEGKSLFVPEVKEEKDK